MSVRRNTAYNIAGAIIPLAATLVTLPIYLHTIGEERYGVLAILWTLLGYFGLFDLGLGRAVTHRIAAFKDRTSFEREQIVWTALFMNLVLGCVGALALSLSGSFIFAYFIDAPGQLTGEVYAALPWMVLAFPLLLASSVLSGALMGREMFFVQNSIKVATGLLIQIAPLVVALTLGPELQSLVVAVLGVRLLSALAMFAVCAFQLPLGVTPRIARYHLRPLFTYGGWITVTSATAPLLSTLDRILIGSLVGLGAVTAYTVPFALASRITVLPGSLSAALFPRMSGQTDDESQNLVRYAIRVLLLIITPLIVAGILIMRPFLTWWLGGELATQAATVGEIICMGLWANCLAYIPFARLQAQGRPDVVSKIQLLQLPLTIPMFWFCISIWGVIGAAMAWSLRTAMGASLQFVANGIGAGILRLLPVPALLVSAAGLVVLALPTLTVARALLSAAVFLCVILWLLRERQLTRQRQIVTQPIRRATAGTLQKPA